jgi:hypothetical protein
VTRQAVLIEPGNIRNSFGEAADQASAPILDRLNSPSAPLYAGYAAATVGCGFTSPVPRSW